MTRPLDAATSTALGQVIVPVAAIVRLDILADPLYCWTGIGDLVFAGGATGDTALDGFTYKGTGAAAEFSSFSDGVGGSDVLEITFPGVDLNDVLLKQLLTDRRRWQFRRAWIWLVLLDPVTDVIVGKPFRVKSGRMDTMPITDNIVKCRVEGQQSYGDEPLGTRYSEARDINPTDVSQNYVHSLANMTPNLGKPSATVSGATGGGGGAGGGSGPNHFMQNNMQIV